MPKKKILCFRRCPICGKRMELVGSEDFSNFRYTCPNCEKCEDKT